MSAKTKKNITVALITIIICLIIYIIGQFWNNAGTDKEVSNSDVVTLTLGKTYDLLDYHKGNLSDEGNTTIIKIVGPDESEIDIPEEIDGEILFTPNNGTGIYKITYETTYLSTEEEEIETGVVKTTTTGTYPFLVK